MTIKLESITLRPAEGPIAFVDRYEQGLQVASFAEANEQLRTWRLIVPAGDCWKLDFTLHFEDGETYKGTFSMRNEPGLDLLDHVKSYCRFWSNNAGNLDRRNTYANFLNNYLGEPA